jgi:hypothetical protein
MVACWHPYRKGQKNVPDQVQNIVVKFAHHRNDLNWETLTQRRKIAHICALFKVYMGERAWKPKGDRLQAGSIMIGKLEAGSKRQISENIPL